MKHHPLRIGVALAPVLITARADALEAGWMPMQVPGMAAHGPTIRDRPTCDKIRSV